MIRLVNPLLNGLFDLLMWPCIGTSPWPGLIVASFFSAAMFVALFRVSSHQHALRRARNRLVARTLELLFFQHDLRVTLTACGRIFATNVAYLIQFLLPMAIGSLPLILLFAQFESWFERRPLKMGEQVVLTIQLDAGHSVMSSPVELRHSAHVRTDTPAMRIPSRNELAWRLVAVVPGQGWVEVTLDGVCERIALSTGDQVTRIGPRRDGGGVINELFAPSEPPLAASGPFRRLEISYPRREIDLGGRSFSWPVIVIVLMMVFSLVLARLLGVRVV